VYIQEECCPSAWAIYHHWFFAGYMDDSCLPSSFAEVLLAGRLFSGCMRFLLRCITLPFIVFTLFHGPGGHFYSWNEPED